MNMDCIQWRDGVDKRWMEQLPTLKNLVDSISIRQVVEAATLMGIVRKSRKPSNMKKIIKIKRYLSYLKNMPAPDLYELDENDPHQEPYVEVNLTVYRAERKHFYFDEYFSHMPMALTQRFFSFYPVDYSPAELLAAIVNSRV